MMTQEPCLFSKPDFCLLLLDACPSGQRDEDIVDDARAQSCKKDDPETNKEGIITAE